MKRSNRLILLIGVFLAVIAFIGIVVLSGGGGGDPGGGGTGGVPTTGPTVFAAVDIPLGTEISADMLRLDKEFPLVQRDPTAFADVSLVVGKIARTDIVAGKQLTLIDFSRGGGIADLTVPPGLVGIAIQVDQVSGVGTVIQPGDFVDMLVGFTGDKFPVVTVSPADDTITVVAGVNSTSVKLLVQGMQVIGTLLPPPPVDAQGNPVVNADGTALTGQQEIVIVGATPQQAEIIKFAQLDGSISLVLRSAKDFSRDPVTGELLPVLPVATTGVILKTLVDEHGVLVPQLLETILPAQAVP